MIRGTRQTFWRNESLSRKADKCQQGEDDAMAEDY